MELRELAANRRRKAARRSLIALLAFLILQNIVQVFFGEPYPAIKMPSFRVNGDRWDAIFVRHPEPVFYYEDGTEISISRGDLFPELRTEMSLSAIDNLMKPESSVKLQKVITTIRGSTHGFQVISRLNDIGQAEHPSCANG